MFSENTKTCSKLAVIEIDICMKLVQIDSEGFQWQLSTGVMSITPASVLPSRLIPTQSHL